MDHSTAPDGENRLTFKPNEGGGWAGYVEIKYTYANVFKGTVNEKQ
jgi:hypothetical protein